LETFAEHDSRSVQHTLYAMGEAVVRTLDVEEIHLAMPNRHHIPVDLRPFGMENRNEIFVATTEPYGLIEGTVRRG
ncbi:MAG: urate oxidase, partial [Acidobacteria bacterium]